MFRFGSFLKSRTKGVFVLVASIFIIFSALIFSVQWKFLQYRFFMLSPADSFVQNMEYIVGSGIDAALTTINSFLILFDEHNPPVESKIKTFNLRVERGSIEEMASHLPESAKKKYYRAWLLYPDGEWKRINFRFRGRNIWHWHPEKPSLRLKLKKRYPLNLQRKLNLVNPEDRAMVSNMIGDEIGHRLGVLTHITEPIRLFINNNYFGVYHWITREDEEMLRLRHKMPGPLFIGDHLSSPWEAKQFVLGGETKMLSKFNPIDKLIEIMYKPQSPEKYRDLWNILSFEKLAGWMATMNIAGGIHTDRTHNHLYYFDPSLGLLEPIIQDINGHGLQTGAMGLPRLKFSIKRDIARTDIPLNERLHPLNDIAFKDPFFYHRRNEILYKAIISGPGSGQEQSKILNSYFEKIDPHVKADRYKAALECSFVGWFRIPYSNFQYITAKENILKWITNRNAFLLNELSKATVNINLEDKPDNPKLLITINGHSAVKFDTEHLKAHLIAHTPHRRTMKDVTGTLILYPGLQKKL